MRRALALTALIALAGPAEGQSLEQRRQTLAAIAAQESALTQKLGAERNALARLVGALEMFSRDPPPPLLVSPVDARDAVRAMILAKVIAPELARRARTLEAEAARLALLRREVAQASGALFAAESALADRQGRLDAVTRDVDLLTPPSARVAAVSSGAGGPPISLVQPASGRLATRFGGRLASGLAAEGVAWRTAPGARVVSPAAAVVAYAGRLNGWGEVVILRAGGGCHMVLAGLGKVTVTEGQSVAAAFPVGAMPGDGQTPPELYLEVRMADGPIDPARLMAGGR